MAKDVRLILRGPRGSDPKRTLSIEWRGSGKIDTVDLCRLDDFEAAEVARAGAVQWGSGGWIEDSLETEEPPQKAPNDFVEVLPVEGEGGARKRRSRRRRRRGAKVKMGFASERLKKRTKSA